MYVHKEHKKSLGEKSSFVCFFLSPFSCLVFHTIYNKEKVEKFHAYTTKDGRRLMLASVITSKAIFFFAVAVVYKCIQTIFQLIFTAFAPYSLRSHYIHLL